MPYTLLRHAVVLLAVGLAGGPLGLAAAQSGPPLIAPVVVDTPPVLDAVLDDPCWAVAVRAEGFFYPTENRPETERTTAWLCLDATHLYVAFHCFDSRPETILSQQTQRGGSLIRDDYVAFHVDPTRRQVDHYSFRVSANGTQEDTFPASGSTNVAWRGDWRAAGGRVADGYVVEMAIPFSILRYPKGQTSFAVAFGRNFERKEEDDIWPPMRDRFERRHMAVLEPLDLPDPVNRPAILPYGIFRADDDGVTVQAGLDVKHVFGNGVTALATLNPDFRNIEDVVETLAFSDTPRYLGEPRPFFREGDGYYPARAAFGTRLIPDVTAAAKAFGRGRRGEFGVVGVLSDRGRWDAAFDYNHLFTPDISLGTGLVYTSADGPRNWVSASHLDGRHTFGAGSLVYSADFYHSQTDGPGGDGNAFSAIVDWGGQGVLGFVAQYDFVDPTYNPAIGFVSERDLRGWKLQTDWTKRLDRPMVQNANWYVNHIQRGRQDGSLLQASYAAGGGLRFNNGTSCSADVYSGNRPPNRDRTVSGTFRWGLETLHEEGGLAATYGRRGGADYWFVKLDQGWSPLPPLRFGFVSEYTWQDFDDVARRTISRSQNVVTATWELSPYSNISARFIERGGNLNLFLAYRNAPLSGRGFYIFLGDPNTQQTQLRFQAKLIWPF